MLRIDRTANGTTVFFRLSGRIGFEELAELEAQIKSETEKHIVLDLKDVVLLDLNAVKSLDRFEMERVELTNAPVYIRAWIESERERLRMERDEIGPSNKKFN
jgi:MFS superfamily sulfate permease-like transporter